MGECYAAHNVERERDKTFSGGGEESQWEEEELDKGQSENPELRICSQRRFLLPPKRAEEEERKSFAVA